MFSCDCSVAQCWKVIRSEGFVLEILETIEGLPTDHQVALQVLSSTAERNENVIVGPVGNILRQTQVTMVPGIGMTEEASGGYVMHFRREPVDDGFVGKPNRLGGGECHEGAGRRNSSGLIDPEYSKLIRIQTGKNMPGSVACGAGAAQPEDLPHLPFIGIRKSVPGHPGISEQFTTHASTIYQIWA
jgi:hypothetical protein